MQSKHSHRSIPSASVDVDAYLTEPVPDDVLLDLCISLVNDLVKLLDEKNKHIAALELRLLACWSHDSGVRQ
jgi:hypothetical protein